MGNKVNALRISTYFILLLLIISSFSDRKEEFVTVNHQSFTSGEVLEFKLSYGMFVVGKAQMKIHKGSYNINGRECYRMDIFGKTSGAVDWVAKINDNWGAYVDTAALVPHMSYRKIEEGKYRKNEVVKFDHSTNMIEAKVVDRETGDFKEPEYFQAPDNIRDIISGFLYLRSIDYDSLNPGDYFKVDAFFEDTMYDFTIQYKGKEEIKTKVGKFNAIRLEPVMPDNQLFAGENAVTVWFSDDLNKIPLKAEVNLVVGKAACEIISFEGLRN